jgi:putative hydrolase of the HAD superfamily
MQKRCIKLITFDLDDTLWQVEPVLIQAELAVADWMQTTIPEVAARYDREQLRQLRITLCDENPQLIHQISELRICAMQRAIEQCGYPTMQARELSEQAFAVFIEHRHNVILFDGAKESLEELSKHYQLGVITNGNADIFRLAVGEYFSVAVTAEQLKISKPAPEPFLAILASKLSGRTSTNRFGQGNSRPMQKSIIYVSLSLRLRQLKSKVTLATNRTIDRVETPKWHLSY